MKKIILLLSVLLLAACSQTSEEPTDVLEQADITDEPQVSGDVILNEEDLSTDKMTDDLMVEEHSMDSVDDVNDMVEIDVTDNSVEMIDTPTDVDTSADPPISEWCDAGYTFEHEGQNLQATIIGPETFKGKEYCKGEHSIEQPVVGVVETTYYFTYGGKDMWVISTVAGQTTEMHVMNE